MEIHTTDHFDEGFTSLAEEDQQRVDDMLDRLLAEHAQPQMRDQIRIGEHFVWATPRIHGVDGALYRVTWRYHPKAEDVLVAVTVAEV